jgi:hypothetical protein
MTVAAPELRTRDSQLLLIVVMAVLAIALLWFATRKAHYLTDYSLKSYTDYFWPRRTGLVFHLLGGTLAITAGLMQIWLGLTNRIGALHRGLGKVYCTGVLIGSIGGFYLGLTIPGHIAYRGGLLGLNLAWLLTTGMALYAVRTRRFEQHREWMLRSYTVTFAFITYRLASSWLRRWISVPDDQVADEIDNVMAWACWAIPLLLAEPLIQLRSMRRSSSRAPTHQVT